MHEWVHKRDRMGVLQNALVLKYEVSQSASCIWALEYWPYTR